MESQSNYADKKKLLFDSLLTAEKCIMGTNLEQRPMSQTVGRRSDDSKTMGRRFSGRESIFKRPAAPISKCLKPRQTPDYQVCESFIWCLRQILKNCFFIEQKNPHKWKRYSLEDTDISDRSNTSAAFQFLAEIEKNKQNAIAMDDDDHEQRDSDKIVFRNRRKPTFNQTATLRKEVSTETAADEPEKSVLKGSKLVMPEYVIGAKQKTKDKKRTHATASGSTEKSTGSKQRVLQLQHLMDEEDEDDQ